MIISLLRNMVQIDRNPSQIWSAYSFDIYAIQNLKNNVTNLPTLKWWELSMQGRFFVYSGQYKFNVLFSSMSCVQMPQQSVH